MTQSIRLRLNHGIFRADNWIRWPWCCPLIRCPDHVSALDCADNATGFGINPLSCASPLGHPRFLCRQGSWSAWVV